MRLTFELVALSPLCFVFSCSLFGYNMSQASQASGLGEDEYDASSRAMPQPITALIVSPAARCLNLALRRVPG